MCLSVLTVTMDVFVSVCELVLAKVWDRFNTEHSPSVMYLFVQRFGMWNSIYFMWWHVYCPLTVQTEQAAEPVILLRVIWFRCCGNCRKLLSLMLSWTSYWRHFPAGSASEWRSPCWIPPPHSSCRAPPAGQSLEVRQCYEDRIYGNWTLKKSFIILHCRDLKNKRFKMYTLLFKSMFFYASEKSLMLTKAAFIWSKNYIVKLI